MTLFVYFLFVLFVWGRRQIATQVHSGEYRHSQTVRVQGHITGSLEMSESQAFSSLKLVCLFGTKLQEWALHVGMFDLYVYKLS